MTLGANQIGAYAADLLDLEEKIEQLQTGKRNLYKAIRDEHGKGEATSLKLAVKLSRMDDGKRSEAEAIDTEAQRMLAIIAKGRAPRATRESARDVPDHSSDLRNMVSGTTQETNDAEAFDAETGEFTTTHRVTPGGPTEEGAPTPPALSSEQIQPETATSFSSVETKSGIGSARDTSAMLHPGVVDGPTTIALQAGTVVTGGESAATNSIQSDDPTEPAGAGPKTLAGRPNSLAEAPTESGSTADGRDETVQSGERPEPHPAALNALKLRPWCLHANDLPKCAGVGKKHCFTCQKAHADAEGETA